MNIYNTAADLALAALHQLPPPPADFTGRARELAELTARMERGGATISGLQGLGGVGKTALALKLARQLTPRYPDAQFYLDLKGASLQPLSAAEALAHVIRAYHPTARLPEGETELRAQYLSVLHGRRALVLMDNAADPDQVAPLVPPESCVLLVTSRQHFTLPGLHALSLDALPPADARELLLKIAPRIGDHADEIAELCGRLPLALRLAASALAVRPDLSPAAYARRLSDALLKTLTGVEASLGLSYDLLTTEQQTLWRHLSVFPAPFDARAAAAVWQLEPDPAHDRLGDLLKYSLLDWDDTLSRYRLHDLARLLADSRLTEDERYPAQLRYTSHYLKILSECGKLYLQGGEALKIGLTLFDTERQNIEAGWKWASQRADNDEVAAHLCNRYASSGSLLSLRLHPRQRIAWLETALASARQFKDRRAEGVHLNNMGLAHDALGETQRAIELYEQRLEIARESGDRRGEGSTLGNLGIAYKNLGEVRRAIEFYEQHLAIARELGDRRGQGNVLGNMGVAYYILRETSRAIELQEQRLDIAREIGDHRGESNAMGNLGLVYAHLGEMDRAIELFKQQLGSAREIGHRIGEGNALFNIALALHTLGNRAEAIANAEAALKIYEQIESPKAKDARELLAKWRGEA